MTTYMSNYGNEKWKDIPAYHSVFGGVPPNQNVNLYWGLETGLQSKCKFIMIYLTLQNPFFTGSTWQPKYNMSTKLRWNIWFINVHWKINSGKTLPICTVVFAGSTVV